MMQTNLPPVFFNHLYVVLDDKTYRAIQASDFLRNAFPGMEQRATLTGSGETWYGTYFYCRDNYLELFGATTGKHWQPGAQEGWAGLAFSTDQVGGVARVRQALQQKYQYTPFNELRQLRTPQKMVNWFYHVKLVERLSVGSFDSWVMEYHPDIFQHKDIALSDHQALTRQAYLSPWNKTRWEEPQSPSEEAQPSPSETQSASQAAATQSSAQEGSHLPSRVRKASRITPPPADEINFPRTPVFSRLTGATIHLETERARRYAEILRLLGYTEAQDHDGMALTAHGFTVHIQPEENAPSGYRLSSLHLEMARPSVAPMTFVFATGSRLVLHEDMTAEWLFGRANVGRAPKD